MTDNGLVLWALTMALIGFAKVTRLIWSHEQFAFATETGVEQQDVRCPKCKLEMHFVYTRIDDQGYTPDLLTCPCNDRAYTMEMQCIGRLN